jgi:hypothetical protein
LRVCAARLGQGVRRSIAALRQMTGESSTRHAGLERFPAKWMQVRVKKTRPIKKLEPRFDSIETGL